MIKGNNLELTPEELNTFRERDIMSNGYMNYVGTPLYHSEHFRKQCVSAGFYVTELYPIYHQGWEMDEWGGVGIKDGNRHELTTDHGSLQVSYIPTFVEKIKRFFA